MTFEDLSKQLNTSVQSLQNLVQVLSTAFADMEGGGGGGTSYSTEERVVGTWIDGNPLYQKTIAHSGALVVDNSFSNDIGTLANVDQFVKCEGYFRRTSENNLMLSLNGGIRPESNASNYNVSVRFFNNKIQVAVNGYNDIEYIALTVQYTKTTD